MSRFQILSLSGGGIRGLFTARLLERLEEHFARPIHSAFDLIAGTSIGGIIALGLSTGRSAAELRDLIERKGREIFQQETLGWLAPLYKSDPLRTVIEGAVGSQTVMAELVRPVIVPAVALTAGRGQIFRTPHHPAHINMKGLRVSDVALATSAAPMYFPIARVGNGDYVDGGLIANAPDLIAFHEAEAFFNASRSDIFILAVGTSFASAAVMAWQAPKRGLLGWIRKKRLLEVTFAGQQSLAQQLCRDALKDRYVLLDHQQGPGHATLTLDNAAPEALATLRDMADSVFEQSKSSPQLNLFGSHNGRELGIWADR